VQLDVVRDLSATPSAVFALLADEKFLTRYAQGPGAIRSVAEVTPAQAGTPLTTMVQRTLSTSGFPSAARRFVGETVDVVETVRWEESTGDHSGAIDVRLKAAGREASFVGTVTLSGTDGSGCRYRAIGEVKVGIPMVGRTLEKPASGALKAAIGRQLDLLVESLESGT
jgi:hypothetical protein